MWRSGMAGWQPWRTIPALASAPTPPGVAGTPVATAPRGAADLAEVDLTLLVILSIVTFGVYGLVTFYRAGERYARLTPQRSSNFETLFWIYVACYVLELTGWVTFPPVVALAAIAGFVVGILLLNEALALRAELARAHGLRVELMSDTAHRALWIIGSLTTWMFGLGLVALVIQGFKFFDDHNQLAAALRASGAQPSGGAPIPPAPSATATIATPAADAPLAPAAPAEAPFPAERSCIRCGGPLAPADRFCSRCGTAAA